MEDELETAKILVLGAGNRWRGDDDAGCEVARRLSGRRPGQVEAREVAGEASELIAAFAGHDAVIIVDAVILDREGAAPGTVLRFDALASSLPAELATTSSHGFGVAQAIELARRLGRLPRRLIVYAIVGQDFAPGKGLSAPVERAVGELVERVITELDRLYRTPPVERPRSES